MSVYPYATQRHSPGILFAEDFDLDEAQISRPAAPESDAPEPPPVIPSFSAEEMEQACVAARAAARIEALEEAAERHRLACRSVLGQIAEHLAGAERATEAVMEQSVEEAARLMFTALSVLLPETCSVHDASEITGLVRNLMSDLSPVPALEITVAPALEASLRRELQSLPPELRASARVTAQEGMAEGDAQLIWTTGAASRSRSQTIAGIESILQQLGLVSSVSTTPPARASKAAPHTRIMESVNA
jgi:hypothetical protein